nr:unnamed protein product [Callosobruchus analis]
MTSQEDPPHEDLIDFHVRSPVLPRAPTVSLCLEHSDNLIDSELPILEKKLQSVPSRHENFPRRKIVDVEDILIVIDDEDNRPEAEAHQDIVDGPPREVERCRYDVVDESQRDNNFFDVCDNHLEALTVLQNLDEVLNATLLDMSAGSEGSEDCVSEQRDIEDCLQDLDNYLNTQEDTSSESSGTLDSSAATSTYSSKDATECLRDHLRHIEQNYAMFAKGCVNSGYVDTEPPQDRPASVCEEKALERPKEATKRMCATVAVGRRELEGRRSIKRARYGL